MYIKGILNQSIHDSLQLNIEPCSEPQKIKNPCSNWVFEVQNSSFGGGGKIQGNGKLILRAKSGIYTAKEGYFICH